MLTDVQIINLGLSKLASSRVKRIDPPSTPLEQYMAVNYPQWKRAELTRRRWVFAYEEAYKLTKVDTLDGVRRKYKYAMPIDCLRPIRTKRSEWVQRGKYIYSSEDNLYIDYIRNAPESEFDVLFNEVLGCKVAWESAEYVTQSSTKRDAAEAAYDKAVADAARANAFITGPESVSDEDNDEAYSWLGVHNHG
ncbi:hypothetical protein EKK58_09285 [Candidatus Dependentiae bacterium]|nr:MAG: hypothetical protein EKK58_09285 [Candidatus Dependentiae bacterium]